MTKEELYYIYRVQYENLINELDKFYFDLDKTKISKTGIIMNLRRIYKENYNNTYFIKDSFEKEGDINE